MKSRDQIEQHLTQQKARAVNGIGGCVYRGTNGTKCAVGCLIPDESYQSIMEGHGAARLVKFFPDVVPNDISKEELGQWQRYHDDKFLSADHRRFSYRDWVADPERVQDSPAAFKAYMAEVNGEATDALA